MEENAKTTGAWLPPCRHDVDQMFDLEEALTLVVVNLPHPAATSAPAVELPPAEEEEDVDEDTVCSICTEGFRTGDGKRAPCGHVYHSACISTWLSRCNSCPLCRAQVVIH